MGLPCFHNFLKGTRVCEIYFLYNGNFLNIHISVLCLFNIYVYIYVSMPIYKQSDAHNIDYNNHGNFTHCLRYFVFSKLLINLITSGSANLHKLSNFSPKIHKIQQKYTRKFELSLLWLLIWWLIVAPTVFYYSNNDSVRSAIHLVIIPQTILSLRPQRASVNINICIYSSYLCTLYTQTLPITTTVASSKYS